MARYFDTNAASEGFSKRLLTSSSSMAPIAVFVRRKTDTTMQNKKYSVVNVSKKLMDTAPPCND